jgi:hypothetical protein
MARDEKAQERLNLICEAQQCDEDARGLIRRADHLEFALQFPDAANHLRSAAVSLGKTADDIRSYLRK